MSDASDDPSGGQAPPQRVAKSRWPLTGWALGLADSTVVFTFSIAPLLFTVLILLFYPPEVQGALTIPGAFGEYFGRGELLLVALAIGGSVAAKIWLDASYHKYSSSPFLNGMIVVAAVIVAIISFGRVTNREPEFAFTIVCSTLLLVAAFGAYSYLIAKGTHAEPHSVETSLKKSSDDLAAKVRLLRSQGEGE
jgi:hypothetical protein